MTRRPPSPAVARDELGLRWLPLAPEVTGGALGIACQAMKMHWSSAPDERQRRTDDWLFDECESAIPPESRVSGNPQIQMLMSPKRLELQQEEWKKVPIAMLVTSTLIVVARRKGSLGKKAEVHQWFRYDFSRYDVGLWRGSGPLYEVRVDHEVQGRLKFVFDTPREADTLGGYFANG